MFTRRQAIVALSAASCAGCSIQPLKPAEPGRGWVVSKGVRILGSAFSGRSVIETEAAFGIGSPFRIASITKLIVAMAIYEWAARRYLNLNETVSDVLPNTPEGVTLSNLLSHRSGLKDPDVYWADIETDIRTLFDKSDFTHKPDTYFRYANLNYGLAATVVEARLGERFDLLIWKWLTRQGLDAGLNWSGVSRRLGPDSGCSIRHPSDQPNLFGPRPLGTESLSTSFQWHIVFTARRHADEFR